MSQPQPLGVSPVSDQNIAARAKERFERSTRGVFDRSDATPEPSPAVVDFPAKIAPSLPKLLGRLRFRHLSLLAALDEHRSLHRAAAAVHLAQPSATKIVHGLELLFGFPLFDRLPTGMRPTESGALVLGFARRSLIELKRFADEIDGRKAGRHGQLVIGALLGAAPNVVAKALAAIKQHRPLLSVKILSDASDEIINQLLAGHSDIAVGYVTEGVLTSKIDCEVVKREASYVVVRKHHPLLQEPRLDISELERAAWIFQPLTNSYRPIVERDFRQAGMETPANIVESNSIGATLGLLLTSNAVTILPESLVETHLHDQLLVRLPITIGQNLVEYAILSRRGEPLGSAAREFGQLLRDHGTGNLLAVMHQTLSPARAGLVRSL